MTHGTSTPPQRRPPGRPADRLHAVVAGAVAVIAVLVGILLVNLLNGKSDPEPPNPVTAPSRAPDGGSPSPSPSVHRTTPAVSPTHRPSPAATTPPAERPASAAPAQPGRRPPVTAPVVVLNNSRISGLAEKAAGQVEAAGFPVERTGNFQSLYDVPVSTVFYDDSDAAAAQALKDAIPGIEKIVPRSQTRIVSTDALILVITRDFPADPEK